MTLYARAVAVHGQVYLVIRPRPGARRPVSADRDLNQRWALALKTARNSSADCVAIVWALRRHAHRRRQLLKADRRIHHIHADEPAGLRVGVAQRLGYVLQAAIAAVVEDNKDRGGF